MTVEVTERVPEKRAMEGAIIDTGKHKTYPKAIGKLLFRPHRSFNDEDNEPLEPINDIHSAIRSFHGVSTKWPGLYRAHFKWIHGFGHSGDKTSRQVRLGKHVHRWRNNGPMS